ncbi:very short patch repair endonuclease [Chitinolyticbacter albus]|uniref:very short patch repair endonuclease n=1 Tax=Chitinolyticbacter albus TaxID=2961951 RepID=UPI00210BD2A9|nr:very short patch repair endonuclease [Chitinolyticbacter albus]
MSRNKGRNTKPEIALRKYCWILGMRYRIRSSLVGRPDFYFPKEKIAVFVDGCFWHGCPFHYKAPSMRSDFWSKKLEANRIRDALVTATLSAEGWQVIRIWEHDLKTETLLRKQVEKIQTVIQLCRNN